MPTIELTQVIETTSATGMPWRKRFDATPTRASIIAIVDGKTDGFFLDAETSQLYQDTGATTPVTTPGQSVHYASDLSTHAHDFKTGTNPKLGPTSYQEDAEGNGYLLAVDGASGVGDHLESVDTFGTAMDGNPYVVVGGLQFNSFASDKYWFTTRATSSANVNDSVVHIGWRGSGNATHAHWNNDNNYTAPPGFDAPNVHTAYYDDPGNRFYLNYDLENTSLTTPSALDQVDKIVLFDRERYAGFAGTEGWDGRAYAIIGIINDTLSDTERASIVDWMRVRIGQVDAIYHHSAGAAYSTETAFSITVARSEVASQGSETDTAFAMTFSKANVANLATETDIAQPMAWAKTLLVGQATETDTANSVGRTLAVQIRAAYDVNRALPLSSGLPPFKWQPAPATVSVVKPSKRRLSPIALTDDVTGQVYVIVLGSEKLLELQAFTPKSGEYVYPSDSGPTIWAAGRTFRLRVADGVLVYDEIQTNVRTRPILFGQVARPRVRDLKYMLTLPPDAV